MIVAKNLCRMTRKWQRMAAVGMRRISPPGTSKHMGEDGCKKSLVADKGHFVFYTTDHRRFAMPLAYLRSNIFQELFKMSEEEFGLGCDGPMTLPCEAVFIDYIISLIKRGVPGNIEGALINSIATCHWSLYANHQAQL